MSTSNNTAPFYSKLRKRAFNQALDILEQFSFESFERILFKVLSAKPDDRLSKIKPTFIRYFFQQYLHRSRYFIELCNSSRSRELFKELFVRENLICPELYRRMALEAPSCLNQAIRRNRVPFIREKHFDEIFNQSKNTELAGFLAHCGLMQVVEKTYFTRAEKESEKLKDKTIEEIFALAALWMYYFDWDLCVNQNEPDLYRAREALAVCSLNHFLSHALQLRSRTNNLKEDPTVDIERYQVELLLSEDDKPPFFEVFEAWFQWHHHVSCFVDEFCFSDATRVYFDNSLTLCRKLDPTDQEKYLANEAKLQVYQHFEEVDFAKMGEDMDLDENQRLFLDLFGPVFTRDHRNLFDQFIETLYYNEYSVPLAAAQGYAFGITFPNKVCYLKRTTEGMSHKKNWKQILLELRLEEGTGRFHKLPLSEIESDPLKTVNPAFFDFRPEKIMELKTVWEMFTIDLQEIDFRDNNHHREKLNLFHGYFFRLGSKLLAFPKLLAVSNIYTAFTNLALKIHRNSEKQQEANTRMEEMIVGQAVHMGFKGAWSYVYDYKNSFGESCEGETDGILFDGNTLLGIEFKHSPLKATLEEISNEKEITLAGAVRQLDRLAAYLRTNDKKVNNALEINEKIDLSSVRYTGIIITTNFEFDHDLLNDKYYKISWKEWFWLLENIPELNSVDQLLNAIGSNLYWKEMFGEEISAEQESNGSS